LRRNLRELGFIKDGIAEAIVCTYNGKKEPTAAPTFRNIISTGCATVNITLDPSIFFLTVFKDARLGKTLPLTYFPTAKVVEAPMLEGADACLEVEVTSVAGYKIERAKFTCRVVGITQKSRLKPRVYSRAAFALIESLVHATRIEILISNKDIQEAETLIRFVDHYANLVRRVAPRSAYLTMISEILRRIESWKTASGLST
jgi:hypothetical protein